MNGDPRERDKPARVRKMDRETQMVGKGGDTHIMASMHSHGSQGPTAGGRREKKGTERVEGPEGTCSLLGTAFTQAWHRSAW